MCPGGLELFGSSSNCGSCIAAREGGQFEFQFEFEFKCDYEIGRSCNGRGGGSSSSNSSSDRSHNREGISAYFFSPGGGRSSSISGSRSFHIFVSISFIWVHLICLYLKKSIETCVYVLLSWYALRGEALRPPPCTPPPAYRFNMF